MPSVPPSRLPKVNLYSILARAPPAELGRTALREADAVSKKADKHRKERGSSRKAGEEGGRRKQRALRPAPPIPPRGEEGKYLARDPLGDEVAELDATIQENLRR